MYQVYHHNFITSNFPVNLMLFAAFKPRGKVFFCNFELGLLLMNTDEYFFGHCSTSAL